MVETGHDCANWPQEQQKGFVEEHTRGWATYSAVCGHTSAEQRRLANFVDLIGEGRAGRSPRR